MKTNYEWYFDPSLAEIKQIWREGTLTVDANVLLDLYRYHAQTQENLLAAIEAFQQRVWISDQAAREFFRNRKAVIASAEKPFKKQAIRY